MPTITLTRGLPGSGKTTWAKQQDAVRANRDDLRMSLFGAHTGLSYQQEEVITKVQKSIAAEALKSGRDVIVDDMNLRPKYLRSWNEFALEQGVDFGTKEFPTPIETCILRDEFRDRVVGEDIIRDIAKRCLPKGEFLPYEAINTVPVDKVTYDPDLDHCIIVDIDGTMTTGPHDRGPFDWHLVGQDRPRRAVVNLVNRLLRDGYSVVFMSGRDEVCRFETQEWLGKVVDSQHHHQCGLLMRKEGDTRQDSIVKRELFDQYVRGVANVKFVLDDRNSVVRMWRSLGLPTFQVAEGDF